MVTTRAMQASPASPTRLIDTPTPNFSCFGRTTFEMTHHGTHARKMSMTTMNMAYPVWTHRSTLNVTQSPLDAWIMSCGASQRSSQVTIPMTVDAAEKVTSSDHNIIRSDRVVASRRSVIMKADLLAANAKYSTVLAANCRFCPRCVPLTMLKPYEGADPARPLAMSCNAHASVTEKWWDHQLVSDAFGARYPSFQLKSHSRM